LVSQPQSDRPFNQLNNGIGNLIVLVTGCRRASSRPPIARHVEHMPEKATEGMHDRGVILLPIACEPM